MHYQLRDIPMYEDWQVIKKIEEGWSKDEKFYIQDREGQECLLRISDIKFYEAKCIEFAMIKRVNTLNFPMSKALEMGKCNEGKSVFMLLTWVKGKSLEKEIEKLAEEQQYRLGLEAGKVLKQIHSLPIQPNDLKKMKSRKEIMLQKLQKYEGCPYRVAADEIAIAFMKKNINQIEILPSVFNHGDFHLGNLILTPEGQVGVIDFNRWRFADPYEEFYKIQSFDREVSIPFSRGKIDGYFEGNPSQAFWRALAVYNAYASLNSIVWAIPFGEEEVQGMIRRKNMAFEDYEGFRLTIPKWY